MSSRSFMSATAARPATVPPAAPPARTLSPSAVVGIDVSKASLDVAFGPDAPVERFDNTPAGHRRLARRLSKYAPGRVLLEATGGYEAPLLRALAHAGLPAVRVNPRQVRDFARATNLLAKTDALDARLLVRFAVAVDPPPRPLPSAEQELLACLTARRAQLVGLRTMELNRLEQTTNGLVTRTIRAVIASLEKQIALVEAESRHVIAEHERLARTHEILVSVPGVGAVTAAVLLGQMPELGSLSRQAVAALAGLAPFNHDSGQARGGRHVRGGRAPVRTALYMAALTGLRCNPAIAEDFARLTAAGKTHKVAMTACMRKLLVILNALVRDDCKWGEKKPRHIPAATPEQP